MSTRTALQSLPRPVRPVALLGGGTVHVRGLTVAELRRVDARVEDLDDPTERQVATVLHIATAALAEPDGSPVFPAGSAEDVELVAAALTPDQLEAVVKAACGTKAEAKN